MSQVNIKALLTLVIFQGVTVSPNEPSFDVLLIIDGPSLVNIMKLRFS